MAELLAGQPSAQKILSEYTASLMANAPAPDDHDEIMEKGETFITKNVGRK